MLLCHYQADLESGRALKHGWHCYDEDDVSSISSS
jgi:hypothetical protein